jgi:hypothetical protein
LPDFTELVREFNTLTGQTPPAPVAPAATSSLPPPFPAGSAAHVVPDPNEHAKSAGAPCVRLAGKEWPIPLLAPRQNRIVVPAVAKITKRMRDIAEQKFGSLDAQEKADLIAALGSETELRSRLWRVTDFSFEIIANLESEFFDLVSDALYWSLTRAHPALTRQQFDDMPIGMIEMVDAVGIIAQQTGMMRRADPKEAAGPLAAGEQPSPSSPTGTPSSPTSATG